MLPLQDSSLSKVPPISHVHYFIFPAINYPPITLIFSKTQNISNATDVTKRNEGNATSVNNTAGIK